MMLKTKGDSAFLCILFQLYAIIKILKESSTENGKNFKDVYSTFTLVVLEHYEVLPQAEENKCIGSGITSVPVMCFDLMVSIGF